MAAAPPWLAQACLQILRTSGASAAKAESMARLSAQG